MTVYLSGPITGTKDYRQRFAHCAERVRKELTYGDKAPQVINPVLLESLIPEKAQYEDIMTVCFELLKNCDVIIMMPGWEESRGCNQEYGYARAKGKEIFTWEELF